MRNQNPQGRYLDSYFWVSLLQEIDEVQRTNIINSVNQFTFPSVLLMFLRESFWQKKKTLISSCNIESQWTFRQLWVNSKRKFFSGYITISFPPGKNGLQISRNNRHLSEALKFMLPRYSTEITNHIQVS